MNIDFPFTVDVRGRTATVADDGHVRDMIEQVLFTAPGERVNRPDFGCGLIQLVHAPNSPELATALQFTIQAALQRWLGDVIELQDVDVESDESIIQITVRHVVKATGAPREDTFVGTV
ncbi:GPW/gp25 family protein [Actinomycetospora chibensis]|uniref:GPW/gp25 family protein n=1 Tax=Actinomycetospora chibensis TaxID=663606 RepID=A0ABV9RNM8_9PSEU|nr:GPW/gp25 family protein [Actinomycetospora chibensis]MDD7926958.1 GPW/gp25 family protein [Actinomycetospora chibensis]